MKFFIGLIGFLLFMSLVPASIAIQRHLEETTIHVVSKERLLEVSSNDGKSSSSYKNFVYTDDEAYVVDDSFWNWHFRAGTVYAKIPNGPSTCKVTLSGFRSGFFSMYQNIIAAECARAAE